MTNELQVLTDDEVKKTMELIVKLENLFQETLKESDFDFHFQLDKITAPIPELVINLIKRFSVEHEYVKLKVTYSWKKLKFVTIGLRMKSDKVVLNLMKKLDQIEYALNS